MGTELITARRRIRLHPGYDATGGKRIKKAD
jgi:hypothetical protein